VTSQLYKEEIFFFQKGSRQAPHLFTQSVCLSVPSPLLTKPPTDLHAIRLRAFEGHLYTFSFYPHQSEITKWPTTPRLPSVWMWGVPDRSHVYHLKNVFCGACPLSAQCCTCPLSAQCCTCPLSAQCCTCPLSAQCCIFLTQLHREFWLTPYKKPGYKNTSLMVPKP
jgi:hypothetical protein